MICEVPQHISVFVVLFALKYFCCIVSAIWWYFDVGAGFGGVFLFVYFVFFCFLVLLVFGFWVFLLKLAMKYEFSVLF